MAEVSGKSGKSSSLLVLNSGSSSFKFTVFAVAGGRLSPLWRGQVAALDGAAQFECRDAAGKIAPDGLHPSAAMYALWVERILTR